MSGLEKRDCKVNRKEGVLRLKGKWVGIGIICEQSRG